MNDSFKEFLLLTLAFFLEGIFILVAYELANWVTKILFVKKEYWDWWDE